MEKERAAGLPYSPFMETHTKKEHAQGEMNFIKFVIRPWWKGMRAAADTLSFAVDELEQNYSKYQVSLDEEETPAQEEAAQSEGH